jgi:hypothetical protein
MWRPTWFSVHISSVPHWIFIKARKHFQQKLLHCLIAQEIRGSNRLNVPNSIMFTFPFSYPPGRTSTMLYTGWSNCVYITGGSTPRPAYTSCQKHPLNFNLWVPNRNTNWMSCWNWDSNTERGKIPANGIQVLNKCNALISKYIPHKKNYCDVHRQSKPRIRMAMDMTICWTCKRNQGRPKRWW